MTNRGPVRRYLDGFAHTFLFLNLWRGEKSIGDRLMNYTMPPEDGALSYPWAFASGMLTELAAEVALPIYAITDFENLWPLLAADALIKTAPRILEYVTGNRDSTAN